MLFRFPSWRPTGILILIAIGMNGAHVSAASIGPEDKAFFESKIRPLFIKHCYSCHSAEAKKVRGEFRLDTSTGLRKGSTSGPVVIPGNPAQSLLIRVVRHTDPSLRMPPKESLTPSEITDLETWIRRGAHDPRTERVVVPSAPGSLWSLKPVRAQTPPDVLDAAWAKTPIDRFILRRLEEKGLRPGADAEKRTLLRRVTYDLTGLPPTPEEITSFLADTHPDAYNRVVERLLASRSYGERWGRHWLDVVRYADSAGDNSDYPIPQMVLYRDWVIAAFNQDQPFDAFVREQLAGDLLPNRTEEERQQRIIATGYLANARRFGSYEDSQYPWYLTIEDTIDNLGRTFLGLTINCCRCHDHKFDPLTQEDYYALYGFFQSTRYPWPGIELDKVQRDLVPLISAEKTASLEKERAERQATFQANLKRLEADKAEAEKALKSAEQLADENARKEAITKANKRIADINNRVKSVRKQHEDTARDPLPYPVAYAVAEAKPRPGRKVGDACVQIKGDPDRPGREIPRRFPSALGGQRLPMGTPGSGRNALADWITDPKNPLTSRVLVNRLWHYHFGRGIVPTPSDFGRQGLPPSHPELLDYLAQRFQTLGGSIKALHREIVLSHVYQTSSEDLQGSLALDPSNELLGRFPLRRLDAEAIRDTLLAASGALDRTPGGAHPFPHPRTWDFTQHKPFKAVYDHDRRSVYLMTQRIQRHPFLALFDGPDTNASTARRVTSTTSLQALYLMNDPGIHTLARRLAARLLRDVPQEENRLTYAYLLLFGRPPREEEQQAIRDHFAGFTDPQSAWESLGRALFLSNELVYIP